MVRGRSLVGACLVLISAVVGAACGGAASSARGTPTGRSGETAGSEADALEPPPTDATYGALLLAIEAAPSESRTGCLLEREGSGWRFVGESAPAIAPLPEPDGAGLRAATLATRLRVLSRWGIDGDEGPFVASVTHIPPADERGYRVLLLDGERAWLRATTESGPRRDDVREDVLLDLLRSSGDLGAVLVVATGETRLETLRRYLGSLDAAGVPVGLAVALRPDVEVPSPRPEPPRSTAGRCEALPPVAAGTRLGTLEASVLRDAVGPLRAGLASCADHSVSRRVALGGRLRLAVRIGAEGTTRDACLVVDEIDDEAFRACVLAVVREARWPTPSPSGSVDVLVPLGVPPDAASRQRGLCGTHGSAGH